jgi:hypothetical protein
VDIRNEFPSKYLKASDLGLNQPVVTIDRVERDKVGRGQDTKPVIYFSGKEKGLVLNKTNANKIIELTGSAVTEEWTGFRVILFATTTEFGGETVECIRVKAAKQNGAAPKPAPVPVAEVFSHDHADEDDVPF